MASLLDAVSSAVEALGLSGRRVLVATSGGVDSTVLLHALDAHAKRARLDLVAAHVNHGLRGAASDADEAAARALARKLDRPFHALHVVPGDERRDHPSRSRPTLQEAARAARYRALRTMAREVDASHIATAHHLDDQVETVLLRLLRGCGPDALGGMPERSRDGIIVRPLLAVSRQQIVDHGAEHGLAWREDASNDDRGYTRNRLRHDWIPGLAQAFNPRLLRAVGDLAEAHRRDREWIETLVSDAAQRFLTVRPGDEVSLSRHGWGDLPEALARRLVQRALHELGAGRDLTRVHLERVLDFLREGPGARGGAMIELPGGLRLTRERERHRLRRMSPMR